MAGNHLGMQVRKTEKEKTWDRRRRKDFSAVSGHFRSD